MNARIETIRARLAELEQGKLRLQQELESLSTISGSRDLLGVPASEKPLTTPEERVVLFIRLFRCRSDVFPKMWESHKKGTRGYSPASSAEWVRGLCDKPRVKCSGCQNRSFVPFDESVIRTNGNAILETALRASRGEALRKVQFQNFFLLFDGCSLMGEIFILATRQYGEALRW